nr:hypothetical protein [Tanacetum cinerariifolium]
LTQSKPVVNTNVRPVSVAVPRIMVTRPRLAHPIVTKSKSPIRMHITRSPSPKTSNLPPKVTAAQAPVGNPQYALKDKGVIDSGCSRHMTRNMSYLSDFEELNGGYVAFGHLSHTTRPSAPIIKDWVSDSEDESKTKAPQFVPSFVQSTEQVKSLRPTIQPIETSIPAATPASASPKSISSGKRRNRKTCFVCKSVYHLIKDYDYHAKKMAQPTDRTSAHRGGGEGWKVGNWWENGWRENRLTGMNSGCFKPWEDGYCVGFSEFEGIPDDTCDVPFRDNSPPLDISKDQFENFSDSNDDSTLIDDDYFSIDKVDYAEHHTEEMSSGSTTTHADYSLPKYDLFLFEIEPDQGELTSIVMEDNLGEPRVYVPNVLSTHPTLMLDSDFIPFDNSLPESKIFYFDIKEKNSGSTTIHAGISLTDLECFNFKSEPDPG